VFYQAFDHGTHTARLLSSEGVRHLVYPRSRRRPAGDAGTERDEGDRRLPHKASELV
jgi:hypothetical protein